MPAKTMCIDMDSFAETLQFIISGQLLGLIAMWAAEDFEDHSGFTLFYVFENHNVQELLVLEVNCRIKAPSIAPISRLPVISSVR